MKRKHNDNEKSYHMSIPHESLFTHATLTESIVNSLSPLSFYALYTISTPFKHQCDRMKVNPTTVFERVLKKCLVILFGETICNILVSCLKTEPAVYLTGGFLASVLHADYEHFEQGLITDIDLVIIPTKDIEADTMIYQLPRKALHDLTHETSNSIHISDFTATCTIRPNFYQDPILIVDISEIEKGHKYSHVISMLDITPENSSAYISFIFSTLTNMKDVVNTFDMDVCKNFYNFYSGEVHVSNFDDLKTKIVNFNPHCYLGAKITSLRPSSLIQIHLPEIKTRLEKYVRRGYYIYVIDGATQRRTFNFIVKNPLRWFNQNFCVDEYQLSNVPYSVPLDEYAQVEHDATFKYHANEFSVFWADFWKPWLK